MKYLPPIVISILAFLLGLSIFVTYNKLLGIIFMVTYLFIIFLINKFLPHVVSKIKIQKKMRVLFLVLSIVLFVVGFVLRAIFTNKLDAAQLGRLDIVVMMLLAFASGNYNIFVAVDNKIKEENK